MKTPDVCPKCHRGFFSEALQGKGGDYWRLSCQNYLTHSFVCRTKPGNEDGELIGAAVIVNMKNTLRVGWDFDRKKAFVTRGSNFSVKAPFIYFEPDFSDYDRLIKKLRTIVTFS